MVRPAVIAIKKICKVLPPKDPLDSDEHESLEMSYAAALYQSGGDVDMRIAALLATAGVAIPRLIKYLDEREEKQEQKKKLPMQVDNAQQELVRLQNELKALEQKKREAQQGAGVIQ